MPPRGEVPSFAAPVEAKRVQRQFLEFQPSTTCGKLFGKAGGAQMRNEREAAIIAIPLGFGAVIAVVVAAKRRRQKQKQK